MNSTDSKSPVISRRQRVEDSKPSISAVDVLPNLNPPLYQERTTQTRIQPPSSYNNKNTVPSRSSTITSSERFGAFVSSQWQKFSSQFPILKKAEEQVLRVPPRLRCVFVFFWFAWKIVLLVAFLVLLVKKRQPVDPPLSSSISAISQASNFTEHSLIDNNNIHIKANATKVLYIVTSSLEYNDDTRKTVDGKDRFFHQLLPVMIDSVESMVGNPSFNLDVDIFLVCAYPLKPERVEMIRNRLPFGVGFQFWDDATPLAYTGQNTSGSIIKYKRALARQHRFVIRDKFDYYDMFVAFEDVMLVRGHHVHHYLQLSTEIERLLVLAPKDLPEKDDNVNNYNSTKYFGAMTKRQLQRVVPGFIRVEAIANETDRGAQLDDISIPIDHDFDDKNNMGGHREVNVDPTICCHVHMEPNEGTRSNVPETPAPDDLIVWETNIKAFSLRQFPPESDLLDWAVLMMGPGTGLRQDKKIGGFWSGRKGAFKGEKKPSDGDTRLFAQQGGWMATKSQLIRMNNQLCKANFLPPFNRMGKKDYNDFGPQNVEFWSGSYQFFAGGENHCSMQRIISMNPDHFSNHLLYHTSNNKQIQVQRAGKRVMVRANNLFGQLNHVRKTAEQEKIMLQSG